MTRSAKFFIGLYVATGIVGHTAIVLWLALSWLRSAS